MEPKMLVYVILGSAFVAVAYLGWRMTARNAYEAAEYTVLTSNGSIEVREYPDLMLATTDMRLVQGNDGSFMRLFRYISGGNSDNQKVAMTVPVFMEPSSDNEPGRMGFVLPKEVSRRGAPSPSSNEIQLQTRRGGKFAVLRFSGRMDGENTRQAELKLRNWMKDQELLGDGKAEFAGYDPPWTPGPLRQNEVLIRLK